MPNTTLAANAAAMPIDRRTALGSFAAAGALLAIPKIARAASSDALPALIAAHKKAREAFDLSVDELEAATLDRKARVVGMLGCDYAISDGWYRIAGWIRDHFDRMSETMLRVARVWAAAESDGLALLERDRDAALARLDEAFAARKAAQARWSERADVEVASLLAVAAYRCATDAERDQKARYLWAFRDEMANPEFVEALLRSAMPEGEV